VRYYRVKYVTTCAAALVLLNTMVVLGEEQKAANGLAEFKSEEGKFSVLLPGKPEYEEVDIGKVKEKQHQFSVDLGRGAYLVSYQDNPNLQGSSPKQLAAALESGRDRLKVDFRGKLLESKSVTLDKAHPGLNFRYAIPDANGEARCRFYMVGTRLYQIMAIGVPEFANSEEATRVIESFKLLK